MLEELLAKGEGLIRLQHRAQDTKALTAVKTMCRAATHGSKLRLQPRQETIEPDDCLVLADLLDAHGNILVRHRARRQAFELVGGELIKRPAIRIQTITTLGIHVHATRDATPVEHTIRARHLNARILVKHVQRTHPCVQDLLPRIYGGKLIIDVANQCRRAPPASPDIGDAILTDTMQKHHGCRSQSFLLRLPRMPLIHMRPTIPTQSKH